MRGFVTFFKKELFEMYRTGKLWIYGAVCMLFGIMNVAVAKLTPMILEMSKEQYKDSGIIFNSDITVTAKDAWVQFVKNTPMLLIVTLIMFSGIFVSEYSKGTLIPLLTKGIQRCSVLLAKTAAMLFMWTAGFWLYFGITAAYTAYYWDECSLVEIPFAACCQWLYGIMLLCLIALFSSFVQNAGQVLLGIGAMYLVMLLLGLFEDMKDKLPSVLMQSMPLMTGDISPADCTVGIIVTAAVSLCAVIAAIPLLNRRLL